MQEHTNDRRLPKKDPGEEDCRNRDMPQKQQKNQPVKSDKLGKSSKTRIINTKRTSSCSLGRAEIPQLQRKR